MRARCAWSPELADHLHQPRIAAQLDEPQMEQLVGRGPGDEVVGVERLLHVGDRAAQLGELARGDPRFGDQLGGGAFERGEHGVDFRHVAGRDRQHAHAVARADLDHALLAQPHHGLAHGRAAHVEAHRRLLLQHLRPRRQRAVEDELLEPGIGDVGLVGALGGFGFRQG
jgi:hypothetical protein